MSDGYDYGPVKRFEPDWRFDAILLTLAAVLVLGPGILWYVTGNPDWAGGWVILLLLGLAG